MNLTRDIFGEVPKFCVLIDPDHEGTPKFDALLGHIEHGFVDVLLIGGSTSESLNINRVIKKIKSVTDAPVLLFPGNHFQLSKNADGLLLPSLISGRNADYLIGKHVESASIIHKSGIPVFSMGYILVEGGKSSATSYITQTMPIPQDQELLAAQTALAGQLLGMKCIYIESGSGADYPARKSMITKVKQTINIPLIVGGGISEGQEMIDALEAGADMVVVGTVLERYPDQIVPLYEAFASYVKI